jgi:hypothetical protein
MQTDATTVSAFTSIVNWDEMPSGQDVQTIDTFLGSGKYNPLLLGNYWISNGVVTAYNLQTCKYFKVIKGQRFRVDFVGTSLTLRWGFFSDIPKEGDTAILYGSTGKSTNTFVAPSNGYFAFSYLTDSLQSISIIPLSVTDNIEMQIDSISQELKTDTVSINMINSTILDYVTLNGVYLPNGKMTEESTQNTYYHYVKKGTKVLIKISLSSTATLRWGAFSSIPVLSSQAFDYGSKGISGGAVASEFRYFATQDEYFAVSLMTSALTSISFETEGLLNEALGRIEILEPQVNENTNHVNNLIRVVGEGKVPITMELGWYSLGSLYIGDTFNPSAPNPSDPSVQYKCKKLSCESDEVFTINASAGSTAGLYVFTDSDNKVIDKRSHTTVTNLVITAPLGAAYFYLNDNSNSTSYVGEEDNITKLQEQIEDVKERGHFNGLSSDFSLASYASKTLGETFVRKNSRLSLEVVAFTSLRFGLGYNKYMGYWIEVDSTTVFIYKYVSEATLVTSYSHGLNITSGVKATIVASKETASIILVDAFGTVSKTDNLDWWGGGAAFVTNLGSNTIEGKIDYFPGDITKRIWMFGDSYFSYNQTARWLYYMVNWGFENWLANHLPGEDSINSIINFNNLKGLSVPQFIVWCLGMNDGSDADSLTPNTNWLTAVDNVINYCTVNSIIPILATIPSVPNIYHEGKNNYVRNSGYRYIDFAKAVNAQADGTWTTGLLSGDNVHPTNAGAKVLASQVLIDFPEIMVKEN